MEMRINLQGETLSVTAILLNDIFFYEFEYAANTKLFIQLDDCWTCLKHEFPNWHDSYIMCISCQMMELVKEEYLGAIIGNDKNKERWMQQLFGTGLGF